MRGDLPHHDEDRGSVYLIGNKAMPGLYKIGHTTRDIKTRITELSRGTSVPAPFYLVVSLRSYRPRLVEMYVHSRLSACRESRAREFFRFSSDREAAIEFLAQVVDSGVYEPVTSRPRAYSISAPSEPTAKPTPAQVAEREESGLKAIAGLRDIVAGRA